MSDDLKDARRSPARGRPRSTGTTASTPTTRDAAHRRRQHDTRDRRGRSRRVRRGSRRRPVGTPWYTRAGRRIVRRPVAWWRRPWTNERVVRLLVTSTILVTSTVIMMMVVHLNPFSPSRDLVFDDTTPTGGDMGAHVWAPAYLRDHLLPHFAAERLEHGLVRRAADLPLLHGRCPALAIVALDVVLPYGVAFKLVAVVRARRASRSPVGRSAGSPTSATRCPNCSPSPGSCFLLDESYQIYGGNVKSTMAGEFSFSIALTLGDARAGTARRRVCAPASTASGRRSCCRCAAVSHGIVLIFVAVSAVILCLVWIDRHPVRLRGHHRDHDVAAVGVVGRSVPARPRVHDRHEVRVPAAGRRATRSGTCSSRSRRRSTS